LAGSEWDQLEPGGLAGDTTIFFYDDHCTGLPGDKRTIFNSGPRVPPAIPRKEFSENMRP